MWRVNVTKPDVIELHIDTMVMDNDEAEVRHGGGVSAAPDDMGTIRGGCGVQGGKQAQQPRGYGGEDGSPHCGKNPHEVPFQYSDNHQDGQWIFRPEAVRGIRGTAYWLRSERQAVRQYKGLCCDG